MRADSYQPHYAPSSVGGLMDPAFLRSARLDADGGPRNLETIEVQTQGLWEPLRARLRSAVQHAKDQFRPH